MTEQRTSNERSSAVLEAMNLGGQGLADDIGIGRSGCLEFCDAYPETLRDEMIAIYDGMAEDNTDLDELTARARKHSEHVAAVYSSVRKVCPGGYALFTEEEMDNDAHYDHAGEPVIRPCHEVTRLAIAEVVANFS